ncbi:hypothetical protein PQR05_12320 [Paraburkholderia sediminicola]|uniref:Uncharacterized protein n=1 Tax=Paraburkholderia metrosideri TaxID=580937 RepID=A0ABW9DZA9_9BURK
MQPFWPLPALAIEGLA